jgi:hypothetical protein
VQKRSRIECLLMVKPSDARTSPYAADRESITKVLIKHQGVDCKGGTGRNQRSCPGGQWGGGVTSAAVLVADFVQNRRIALDSRRSSAEHWILDGLAGLAWLLCALDRMRCKQNKNCHLTFASFCVL